MAEAQPTHADGKEQAKVNQAIWTVVVSLVIVGVEVRGQQQLETIPDSVARAGRRLMHLSSTPSGEPPAVQAILSKTELIVRGTVGKPRSYLSRDERAVLT